MLRVFTALALGALAACGKIEAGAEPGAIAAARHVSNETPYIALMTMVQRDNDRGAHTALVINGSERVIYDPAGTWGHPEMPERGDVHFGATDRMVDYYERYHARSIFMVHVQTLPVSAEVAEAALARVRAQGPSPRALCTRHTIGVLNDVPGLPAFRQTWFPENLRQQMAEIPGVRDRYVIEEDVGKIVPSSG